ncbi:MAG: peroxidase, partial [Thermoanaerobaculia bacterium]|nr:peroxidase [Thermoanaerobaculia bacterium]
GGIGRPNPRDISNIVIAQPGPIPNTVKGSDFIWQWGQFLDHDLDLAPGASPHEPFDIEVPIGDPFFDPFSTGTEVIPLERSAYNVVAGVRQQINALTAYVDASNVYGSDTARALELRTLDGTGRLKTSAGDLLPFNVNGFPNAPSTDPSFFLAGDVRANEQVGLAAMHTLFVREHNFWASSIHFLAPWLSDDEVYENARVIVSAEIQAITYREFLPVVLGKNGLSKYKGYDASVNAGIANVFATASYRFGHSMLSPQLLRLDANNQSIPAGPLSLAASFFNPQELVTNGIDPLLRGLSQQKAQNVDSFIVDEVRNFLFGPPGAGGFDLASLNIQRGREHGLASFNQVRVDYGLPAYTSFAQVNPDPDVQARLAAAYATVDDVDPWVGGLSEAQVPGALVGETLRAVLGDQFERLRDGDRFYYESYLPQPLVALINTQTLSRIIRRNTGIGNELQPNAFKVKGN